MNPVERAAFHSVGKASGFALLGIFCISFGFMFRPPLAAFAGGVLCLLLSLVLFAFARWCGLRPYRKTETWLLILKEQRPPAGIAQQVVSVALRSAYLWFARQSALYGAVLLAASIALSSVGVEYLDVGRPSAGVVTDADFVSVEPLERAYGLGVPPTP